MVNIRYIKVGQVTNILLTLILLMWTIWRAPTNASKWRMGFNSAFKGLILVEYIREMQNCHIFKKVDLETMKSFLPPSPERSSSCSETYTNKDYKYLCTL